MANIEECPFCDPAELEGRIIHEDELIISFLSDPKLREADAHALVIPRRHVEPPAPWQSIEHLAISEEVQRLQGIMLTKYAIAPDFHKPMPTVPQGTHGTKVDHGHRHVLGASKESGVFKNGILWGDKSNFEPLPKDDIAQTLKWLRRAA
jgi:diadenosine tetraphosphate (Ap4A) HIT family hydrolase